MRYFVALNHYRTSTSDGFGNTWYVVEVGDKKEQTKLLNEGMPVKDNCYSDGSPCYSTKGIRPVTAQERRWALREEKSGNPIPNTWEEI